MSDADMDLSSAKVRAGKRKQVADQRTKKKTMNSRTKKRSRVNRANPMASQVRKQGRQMEPRSGT